MRNRPKAGGLSLAGKIKALFANGEQGWWYDPSNFSTLYQDSAGTTPVTAVEQPVGLQLDLSKGLVRGSDLLDGKGNPFSSVADWPVTAGGGSRALNGSALTVTYSASSTAVSRAFTLASAAFVLITYTLSNISSGSARILVSNSPGDGARRIGASRSIAGTYTEIVSLPAGTYYLDLNKLDAGSADFSALTDVTLAGNHRFQSTSANRPVVSARVNLFVGTATLATQSVTTRATAHTLTFTGAGSITLSGTATGTFTAGTHSVTTTAGSLTATVSGTVTQADLRETNVGVGLPAYQAVVTSTNYTSTGFPVYIKPNGSNQFMQTNSINFSSTDKMTLWAGLRNLSNLGCIFAETSTSAAINLGTFYIVTGTDAGGTGYSSLGHGTAPASTLQTAKAFTFIAPDTAVISITHNIANDLSTIRRNTVDGTNAIGDKGTGNFGNYPAYFYMRAGTSLPFNGNDYGSIARGAASTAAQIASGETYINSKTKAY